MCPGSCSLKPNYCWSRSCRICRQELPATFAMSCSRSSRMPMDFQVIMGMLIVRTKRQWRANNNGCSQCLRYCSCCSVLQHAVSTRNVWIYGLVRLMYRGAIDVSAHAKQKWNWLRQRAMMTIMWPTKWAPSSYNPICRPFRGVITPSITGWGPPCTIDKQQNFPPFACWSSD